MMYSNARYGSYKQSGIKNRGHFDSIDMEYEIPPYEEMHFMSADELIAPRQPRKPRQAKR